jgi:hypothetical protein
MGGDGDQHRKHCDGNDHIADELDHHTALGFFTICEAMHMPTDCSHGFSHLRPR